MTIQLMDLNKWMRLADGELVRFNRIEPRVVRVDVNAPQSTRLWVQQIVEGLTQEPQFLAVVFGRDRIEFAVDGAFELFADGGEVYFYTVDGADFSMLPVDEASMTRIVERRVINPEVEYMMQVMQINMEKRLEAQARGFEQTFARYERSRDAAEERRVAEARAAANLAPVPADKGADAGGKTGDGGKPAGGSGPSDKPTGETVGADGAGKKK